MNFRSVSPRTAAMTRLLMLLACAVASLPVSALEEKDRLPPGADYLRAHLICSTTLSPAAGAVLTCEHINVGAVPISFSLVPYTTTVAQVHAHLQANPAADAPESTWGPDQREQDPPLNAAAMDLGDLPAGSEDISRTDGVILMPNEGYARRLILKPGWIAADAVLPGHRYVIIDFASNSSFLTPLPGPGAVTPGKAIRFTDAPMQGFSPTRLLPFTPTAPAIVAPVTAPSASAGLLAIELLLPDHAGAGADVTVTYLISNPGQRPIWIEQNRLVPALTSWRIAVDGKPLDSLTAADPTATIAQLPLRRPLQLDPGEFLTWRKLIPARSLPRPKETTYQLELNVDAMWWPDAPEEKAAPQTLALSATGALTTE